MGKKKKVVIVGISGPSSSGKSTLSRLLRSIIPGSFILHQDDFYKPDEEIPIDPETSYANWDCAESLDMTAFVEAMRHIRANEGQFPPTLQSKEDQNELGHSGVPGDVVELMHEEFVKVGLLNKDNDDITLCLVDGFLLYSNLDVVKELDVRMLVRAPYEKLKARREARSGYVTLDGFWKDPPKYFDKIVWKCYVKDHQHLFEDNDVHGSLKENQELNLHTPAQLDLSMQELLMWALGVISDYLQTIQ